MSEEKHKWVKNGAWFVARSGSELEEFCVIRDTGSMIKVLPKAWCVSSAKWMSKKELEEVGAQFSGYGKKNYFRFILFFALDVIHPYFGCRN